ncbi:hypothetical protein A2631_01210 [Candidatus Daviesbacteria bacterium RIFCSPHIGHO2_01_FULL_44_29]|uniref:Dockerin domain-containing protein n=1 Tax=Candidatus Daviesbacteria bacterium RIFCSPHIGHO2_02_FULL_43_12 TaxID=1797776 RepID=A0A1F5KIJ6_9BACT|nr:MAG: hypothetical protein A2631_01210 [Candidatus Daviesbacteria bacterium RIFCSPHIGHO2_01_FULL_44_29]OGE40356.1 MAG: hypothetical protein A3E86_01065 [Candidatus Daviesbacteria bacterium RIFCSPHIGHO2_12_FULL_47_45]OGE40708.1 MAG: hypothetical protein A3D25_05535 [Candidatus Daviesbacteria bacterium RIFCSPHIGHO2_02_FULL_43_12]OGE69795.1 MAG: hypothetical protein A3B55_05275 [Candidatus Daviesbacteria bacterium RIFCSPLOWO2_01_FULL_43_15]
MLKLPFAIPRLGITQIIILVFTILTAIIPITVFLLSQSYRSSSHASEQIDQSTGPKTTSHEVPKDSPIKDLLDNSASNPQASPGTESGSADEGLTGLTAQIVGPTLDFIIQLEGRPASSQAAKIFLGIATGSAQLKPNYLLSFAIDVPASGSYQGLSIQGLTVGSEYTAYLKGPQQIATSSAFTVSPNKANLNPTGNPLLMLTGDLNDDNRIDSSDQTIADKATGSNKTSGNWNPIVDFNLDGVVNNFDLNYVRKNQGLTGASGAWYSSPPIASKSASLDTSQAIGSPLLESPYKPQGVSDGYWMWMPSF